MVRERVGDVDVLREAGREVDVERVEVGSADRNVVGRGSERIDRKAQGRLQGDIRVIATGGTAVAGGHRQGDTLCGGLLPKVVDVLISRTALFGFAAAKADVKNIDLVVVHSACDRQKQARAEVSVCGGVENHIGIGGDAARDLRIE